MRGLPSADLMGRLRVVEAMVDDLEPDTPEWCRAEMELRDLRRAYRDQIAERWAMPHKPGRDGAGRTPSPF